MRHFLVLLLVASCKRTPETTTAPVTPIHAAPDSSRPNLSASASVSPASSASSAKSTTPPDAEALRELDQIRRAAVSCAGKPSAPGCEVAQTLAREYPLQHCGADGVDPAYTFAWAAEEPLPGATLYTDEDGRKWYVEAARSPKLARVDERLWSEASWISVEPSLRFESDYPIEAEAKRLSALDVTIRKKTMAEGIVRAVFYEGGFVGAYPFYVKLEPKKDGGMLYGFGITPKAHPLCKSPQARTLPPDLEGFAGTWSRLR